MDQGQSSQATGTRDETYNIVAVLYHALQGAENCQTYSNDVSGNSQLREFFEQALKAQRQLADQAKMLLHERLMKEGGQGGGSAFSFGEGGGADRQSMGGGSDQFGSQSDAPLGMSDSGQTRSDPNASQTNDPSSGQFGHSEYGQGQRHNEMTTGGGGTSTF